MKKLAYFATLVAIVCMSSMTVTNVDYKEMYLREKELNDCYEHIIMDYYYQDKDKSIWLDVIMETDAWYIADSIKGGDWDNIYEFK